MPSKKYTLNKTDIINIAKVVGYAGASAMVSTTILIMQEVEIPVEYATYAIILNILLVAAKKFLAGTNQ